MSTETTTDNVSQHTRELQAIVLSHYVECGVIGIACDKAGVRRKTHYDWMGKDEIYKEKYEEMRERFVDGLEVVAIERAKEKSDSLLQMLLKAERREKYGDRQEIDLNNHQPIKLVFAEGMLSEDEKELLGGVITEEEFKERIGRK